MGDDRTICGNNFGPDVRIHQGSMNVTFQGDTTTYYYSAPPGTHDKLPASNSKTRDREDDILRRLYTSPYEDRKDRNPHRVPGTCEWFLSHELFKDWEKSESSRLLWVSADPGCGKSVLAKHLVDSVLQNTESRTVCYFFFKDDFADQRTVVGALCCILRQLFIKKPILFSDEILHQFITGGETFANSFCELWKILIQVSKDPNAGEIIYVFDAIDECEDQGRSQLAQELCKLYGTANNFHLKFLLTSRPYGKIHRGFRPLEIPGLPVIHLSGESENEIKRISQEIDIFIRFKIQDIGKRLHLIKEEHDLLLKRLMQITNRTYLWVYLIFDLIMDDIGIDEARIIKATSSIPETVDEAYEKILQKSHDVEQTKKILHIIVGAIRPLTLREMNLALLIQSSHRSNNDLNLEPEHRFRQKLRDICGLFITIVDSKIYLLHQTAKEFLLQDDGNSLTGAHEGYTWKSSLNLLESHRILSDICIWYLLLLEDDANDHDEIGTLCLHEKDNIFLGYSATYWATHFRELDANIQEEKVKLILKICNVKSNICQTWFKVYWASTNTTFPKGLTSLMIAAYFGLNMVVQCLLVDAIELNSRDDTYKRSALSWAARNGFDHIAKLLIRGAPRVRLWTITLLHGQGAEVNLPDKYGRTPLFYAVWNGNIAMVEHLVIAGAQVHVKDELGGTPISYAVCNQNEQITNILLQNGSEAGVEDDINSILFSAAEKGDEEVIELLLKTKKVGPNAKDRMNQTPLQWAANGGHLKTVKMLLVKGANPNYKNDKHQTPLLYAVKEGHTDIVRLLLEKEADPNCKDIKHRTPLLYAVKEGYTNIVRLLLDKGADPNCKDDNHRTPLLYAVKEGYPTTIMKELLTRRAEMNCRDHNYRTPWLHATNNGYLPTIRNLRQQSLLEDNNTLNIIPNRRYEAIIKLLLERGADPNYEDMNCRTALSFAAENGYGTVVKALLERGASPNAYFLYAAEKGNGAAVKLLLKEGADLKSLLLWAALKRHEVSITVLLKELEEADLKALHPWAVQHSRGIIRRAFWNEVSRRVAKGK